MNSTLLSAIKPDMDATVENIAFHGKQKQRLMDLGFLPGQKIHCMYTAPSGSPIAFLVKDSIIALRKGTCTKIEVQLHA